jgi:hypothetical protein
LHQGCLSVVIHNIDSGETILEHYTCILDISCQMHARFGTEGDIRVSA